MTVRAARAPRRLVGGEVDESRLDELMADLSAGESVQPILSWLPFEGSGTPSGLVRSAVVAGGIVLVLVGLLALMWLISLFI